MDYNRNLVAPYSGKNDNPKTNTKVESDRRTARPAHRRTVLHADANARRGRD